MIVTAAEALEAVRQKQPVILLDEVHGHGDLVIAAAHVDTETINFMAREARGPIFLSLTQDRCAELGLRPQEARGDRAGAPAFTESIEARTEVTTGISAHDRARTVQVAADPASSAADICSPGHIFPIEARPGGVLELPSEAEAAIDLVRLAGLPPAAVLCGVMGEDGMMADLPALTEFCALHSLKMVRVAELVEHRRLSEGLLRPTDDESFLTRLGDFVAFPYEEEIYGRKHLALVLGDIDAAGSVPAHIHRCCRRGDRLLARDCQSAALLEQAVEKMGRQGRGVIAYLDVEILDTSPHCCVAGVAPLLRMVDGALGLQMFEDLGLEEIHPAAPMDYRWTRELRASAPVPLV